MKKNKKQDLSFKRILETTRQHISRNKLLSVATVCVISITFTIATIFVGLVTISSRTITEFERKAQIIVFFQPHTSEEDIETVKDTIEKTALTESISYVSEDQAVEIYKSYYGDYPTLVESVTTDDVLPSLEIKAQNVENMPEIKDICDQLAEDNSSIESIMYFKDLVDTLRGISKVIGIGGAVLLISLAGMSMVLILITIGFNINSHKHEIEVMQLIGAPENFVKMPFLLEGTFYGFIGSAISIISLFLLWYGSLFLLRDNEIYLFISQTFRDVNMLFLKEFNLIFILGTFFTEATIGSIIGYISSSIALWKYLE